MKKVFAVLLSFTLLLSLAACNNSGQAQNDNKNPDTTQEQEQNQPEHNTENPAGQEMIELDGIGLTLILPNDWKGKYGVTMGENNASCSVYVKEIRDRENWLGHLFSIEKAWADGPMTPEEFREWLPVPANYLFSTTDATYMLSMASDVQYDEQGTQLYRTMRDQIQDITFQISNPDAVDG